MRTFNYKNRKFSEYIETILTDSENGIINTDFGNNIQTMNIDLMRQKMAIQLKIQDNLNADISEETSNKLMLLFRKIQNNIGNEYEITEMVITYDNGIYTCNTNYRIKPFPKKGLYVINDEELF